MAVHLLFDPLMTEHDPGPGHPESPDRLRAIWRRVRVWNPELRGRLWLASPLILFGALSSWAGTCYELVRHAPGNVRLRAPRGPVASD